MDSDRNIQLLKVSRLVSHGCFQQFDLIMKKIKPDHLF